MIEVKIEKTIVDDDLKPRKFIIIPNKKLIYYKGIVKYVKNDFKELINGLKQRK